MSAKAQTQPPATADQPAGQVYQLLDNAFYPSPFPRVPDRRPVAKESELPDEAKDVIGKSTQSHDQCVGCELAAGQPLQVKIDLELAVELLAQCMLVVQGNDLFLGQLKIRPPAFNRNLWHQKQLTMSVGASFSYPDHLGENIGLILKLLPVANGQQGDFFTRTRFQDPTLGKRPPA